MGVNPQFLLEALVAAGGGQPDLALDGTITPLTIRSADGHRSTMLMPLRV